MSWVEKRRDPETGEWVYTQHGVRVDPPRVRKSTINRGQSIDFSRGPVRMYTEPMKGHGPVDAPAYDMGGMVPVFRNMEEINDYAARNRDAGRPLRWER